MYLPPLFQDLRGFSSFFPEFNPQRLFITLGSGLEELLRLQREFDTKHGWHPPPDDPRAVFRAVQDDLIGIFGEIGEFANIIKKLALEVGHEKGADLEKLLKDRQADLADELIDTLIYLVRLASHLNIDIEDSYIKKLAFNEQRFKRYENTCS